MLALAGCAKKPVAKNDLRTVTTEVVAAAQKITNNKSQIIVRPQVQASKRGGPGAFDDIYISLVTPAEAVTLKQSLAAIAERHGLTALTTVASPGVSRFDYVLNGTRTHSIHVVIPVSKNVRATPQGNRKVRGSGNLAIVIDDMGYDRSLADAVIALPFPLTVSVLPHLPISSEVAEEAHSRGDEVLLQLPMEPFDYPDNDPGPQTLLTTLDPEQNLDRMYWQLSRIQGYAGIANFMGGRFVVTDAVMQPIISEAAKRGLGYFDDGSAPRSVAPSLAAGQAMPFAKADSTIDAVPTSVEIDRALAKLETLAKDRGIAIGVASALPISIERIAVWLKPLESHGIMLVPLTTAMLKSKSG